MVDSIEFQLKTACKLGNLEHVKKILNDNDWMVDNFYHHGNNFFEVLT